MAEASAPVPTMLYKARDNGAVNAEAWNLPLDTKIVDESEVAAAQKDGWQTAAEVHAPKKAAKAGS